MAGSCLADRRKTGRSRDAKKIKRAALHHLPQLPNKTTFITNSFKKLRLKYAACDGCTAAGIRKDRHLPIPQKPRYGSQNTMTMSRDSKTCPTKVPKRNRTQPTQSHGHQSSHSHGSSTPPFSHSSISGPPADAIARSTQPALMMVGSRNRAAALLPSAASRHFQSVRAPHPSSSSLSLSPSSFSAQPSISQTTIL